VAEVFGEIALFLVVVALVTLVSERTLLREFHGYLRGRRAPRPAVAQ
jgi:hypothetical protein